MPGYNELSERITTQRLLERRDKAIEVLGALRVALSEADAALGAVGGSIPGRPQFDLDHDQIRVVVDTYAWRQLLNQPGVDACLDAQARTEVLERLPKTHQICRSYVGDFDVPRFDADTVQATLGVFAKEAEANNLRGIVNLMRTLSGRYSTNRDSRFEIPKKMIYRAGDIYCPFLDRFRARTHELPEMEDLHRALCLVSGRAYRPTEFKQRLCDAINNEQDYEGDGLRVRAFKNGNLHIEILDARVRDALNANVEEYYDSLALGSAGSSQPVSPWSVDPETRLPSSERQLLADVRRQPGLVIFGEERVSCFQRLVDLGLIRVETDRDEGSAGGMVKYSLYATDAKNIDIEKGAA